MTGDNVIPLPVVRIERPKQQRALKQPDRRGRKRVDVLTTLWLLPHEEDRLKKLAEHEGCSREDVVSGIVTTYLDDAEADR